MSGRWAPTQGLWIVIVIIITFCTKGIYFIFIHSFTFKIGDWFNWLENKKMYYFPTWNYYKLNIDHFETESINIYFEK